MPLLREDATGAARTAIWHIAEGEEFFAAATGLSSGIAHPKRRIEYLAGRYLLQSLWPGIDFSLIYKDAHDKPQYPGGALHFSLSHSYPYVAAVVSGKPCGIDIQVPHPRIETLKQKFLSPAEQKLFENMNVPPLAGWCAKEAAYKWLGRRGTDFRAQLPVRSIFMQESGRFIVEIDCIHECAVQQVMLTAHASEQFAWALAV